MAQPDAHPNRPAPASRSASALIASLFSLNRSGGWVRLIFVAVLSGLFFISISPFSDWASQLWQSIQENALPGLANSLRELWRIIRGMPAVPSAETTSFNLPQPGLTTRFELMWTSQGFSSLMQSLLIAFIPFLLAFWIAAYYFQYIHHIPRFRSALGHLLTLIFPVPRKRLKFQNGYLLQKGTNLSLERVGGPAQVHLDPSNAAVFERSNGTCRVLLPGQEKVPLEGYERIRSVLDTGTQDVTVTVSEHTRDGIRLQARGARFAYQLRTGGTENGWSAEQQRDAYQAFVYQTWLGSDWEKPAKRRKSMGDYIATELRQFIARHEAAEFFGAMAAQGETTAPGYQALNPFALFAAEFSRRLPEVEHAQGCLQLAWLGEGEWVLLAEMRLEDHLQSWYAWLKNKLQEAPAILESNRKQARQKAMDRLVWEVPVSAYRRLERINSADLWRGLVIAYRDKLEAEQKSNLLTDPQDVENLELVLKHLRRLTRD